MRVASSKLEVAAAGLASAELALALERQGHTVTLLGRTVRDAADAPSLAVGLVWGFAAVFGVLAGWPPGRRAVLLVAPVLSLAAGLVGGLLEGATAARAATTALPLGGRTVVLALGLVRGAAFEGLGLWVASALLAWGALASGARASRPPVAGGGRRRLLALLVGGASVAAVMVALRARHHPSAWLGASWSAATVLAVALGAPGLGGDEKRRAASSSALLDALLLGGLAVLAAAVARGLASAVGLGDDGPMPERWGEVVGRMRGRFLHEAAPCLWFVVPPPLAALVAARPSRGIPWARRSRPVLLAGAGLLLALVAAPLLLAPLALALRDVRPVLTPPGFVLPVASVGSDCRMMEEDRVVFIGQERLRLGAVDLGPSSQLDDAAGCAAFAETQLPVSLDVWLTSDARGTFARMGCLLDALAAARGPRVPPGSWHSSRDVATSYDPGEVSSSPCTVWWVTEDATRGSPRCLSLTLGHPSCYLGPPHPDEHVEPARTFEITMTDDAPFHIRLVAGGLAIVRDVTADRPPVMDPAGRPTFPRLVYRVDMEWKVSGSHSNADDHKFDFALLRAAPSTPIAELLPAVESIRQRTRDYRRGSTPWTVPALDVGLTLAASKP